MEPNKTGVSEQVLHSEYRRIDSEYREKTSCCKWFFFGSATGILGNRFTQYDIEKNVWICSPHRYWYLRYWKHRKKPCVLVLIAPHSPRQWWYPILLELLVDIPRKLHGRCLHKGMQYKIYNPGSLNLENGNFKSDSRKKKFSWKAQDYVKQVRRT